MLLILQYRNNCCDIEIQVALARISGFSEEVEVMEAFKEKNKLLYNIECLCFCYLLLCLY